MGHPSDDMYFRVERLLGRQAQVTLFSQHERSGTGSTERESFAGLIASLVANPGAALFRTAQGVVGVSSLPGAEEVQVVMPPDPLDLQHPDRPRSRWVALDSIADVQAV